MSEKGIYKMSIKILQLCLVLVSTFMEFLEFSLSSVVQMLKLRLQAKPVVKTKQIQAKQSLKPSLKQNKYKQNSR